MPIYSIGRNSTVTTTANASADVASPTNLGQLFLLMEWGLFLGAATASTYGLNRPTTLGTRTSPVALLAEHAADPALTGITLVDMAVAFSGQPSFGSNDLRLVGLPATIGTGIIWTFPRGLKVANQLSIVIVNRATNSASVNHYAAVEL